MTDSVAAESNPIEAGEYAIVAMRFRDIKDDMSIDNVQNMISAIRLVNNAGYNLPPGIAADLQ